MRGRLKFKRFTDKIRILADVAWVRGNKDLSTDLHNTATQQETKAKEDYGGEEQRR